MLQKQMFKVIAPVERPDGTVWWMRCGNGFKNKDESMNLYLTSLPFPNKGEIKLQVRELTEEDLRSREEKRSSSYGARPLPSSSVSPQQTLDAVPF